MVNTYFILYLLLLGTEIVSVMVCKNPFTRTTARKLCTATPFLEKRQK